MSQQPILKQQDGFKHTMDFLGAFSRNQRADVMGMERGRVSIGGRRPVNACFVVYDNAYAFFFGFNLLGAGLRFKPHQMDFMVPIQDVTALHVGGASQQTATLYAATTRLHLQAGRPFLQLTYRGHETAQFVPEDTSTISKTTIVASKILAGHRTAYSGQLRGTIETPPPPTQPAPNTQHNEPIGHIPVQEHIPEDEPILHLAEQVTPAAIRYFPSSDTYDVGWGSYVLPCQQYKKDEQVILPGYLVLEQDNYGFFEPEDIEAASTEGRSPLVGRISDLTDCYIIAPKGVAFTAPEGVEFHYVDSATDIMLTLSDYYSTYDFVVDYGDGHRSPDENASVVALLATVVQRLAEHMEPAEVLED